MQLYGQVCAEHGVDFQRKKSIPIDGGKRTKWEENRIQSSVKIVFLIFSANDGIDCPEVDELLIPVHR